MKITDRTIYCQTHLADVTLTGARTEEQETNINILPHEKTFTIETSNPTTFKRLVKRTLANPEEWRLTQVWAPAEYPISQCSVACFTAPISCITLRTFSPKAPTLTVEQRTALAERLCKARMTTDAPLPENTVDRS